MAKYRATIEQEDQHPAEEQLMLFVDGELSPKEIRRCESHLDACWSCRVKVGRIQETIADIIKFEDTVTAYKMSRASNGWGNFDSKLNAVIGQAVPRPPFVRIVDFWKQHVHFRGFAPISFATSVVAAVIIVALLYQFTLVQPVNAADVLSRAIDAQNEEMGKVDQPVLRQTIQVRRAGESQPVSWEIWNDTANARVKTSTYSESSRPIDSSPVINDLRSILLMNHMNEHRPLTAASYKNWADTVTAKTEEVVSDSDDLTIHTVRTGETQNGQISDARLVIRKTDYHSTSLFIKVRNSVGGDDDFDLTEQDFAVLSLKDVDPAVFGDPTKLEVASTVGLKQETLSTDTGSQQETTGNSANANSDISPQATADLEVEVMDLLNRAKADMGEQITVERSGGIIRVRGIVDTDTRKREIVGALQPVAHNPSLRIEIQTLADALAAEKGKKKGAVTTENLTAGDSASAAESDLIRHFGSLEAARAFASQMVSRSGRVMSHAYALERLMDQFKPAELNQMSPEARTKFLSLVAQHARAFASETAALRGELESVFGGAGGSGSGPSVNGPSDLPKAVASLLSLARSNDRVLRSAMAVSSEGPQFSALRTPQFWQSLRSAEDLAGKIAALR